MSTCAFKLCKSKGSYSFNRQNHDVLFCHHHKKRGMVRISGSKCAHPGCDITPSFNYKGEKFRVRCSAHKLPGMENVRYKYCKYGDCKKTSVQYTNGTYDVYCNKHIKCDTAFKKNNHPRDDINECIKKTKYMQEIVNTLSSFRKTLETDTSIDIYYDVADALLIMKKGQKYENNTTCDIKTNY